MQKQKIAPAVQRRSFVKTIAASLIGGTGLCLGAGRALSGSVTSGIQSEGPQVLPEMPTRDEIARFIQRQTEFWNASDFEAMREIYREYARDRLIIEYVGMPIGDGWTEFQNLWNRYNGVVKTRTVEVMVNGNEAACYFRNERTVGTVVNPSIEIYKFTPGVLHIRYFHNE